MTWHTEYSTTQGLFSSPDNQDFCKSVLGIPPRRWTTGFQKINASLLRTILSPNQHSGKAQTVCQACDLHSNHERWITLSSPLYLLSLLCRWELRTENFVQKKKIREWKKRNLSVCLQSWEDLWPLTVVTRLFIVDYEGRQISLRPEFRATKLLPAHVFSPLLADPRDSQISFSSFYHFGTCFHPQGSLFSPTLVPISIIKGKRMQKGRLDPSVFIQSRVNQQRHQLSLKCLVFSDFLSRWCLRFPLVWSWLLPLQLGRAA